MPTFCAWCKPMRKINEDPPGIESHGICEDCLEVLKGQLKREESLLLAKDIARRIARLKVETSRPY